MPSRIGHNRLLHVALPLPRWLDERLASATTEELDWLVDSLPASILGEIRAAWEAMLLDAIRARVVQRAASLRRKRVGNHPGSRTLVLRNALMRAHDDGKPGLSMVDIVALLNCSRDTAERELRAVGATSVAQPWPKSNRRWYRLPDDVTRDPKLVRAVVRSEALDLLRELPGITEEQLDAILTLKTA